MKISEEQTHSVKWLAGKESDADLPGLLHAWQLACREARAIDQPIHPLVDILANHHHGFAGRGILRLEDVEIQPTSQGVRIYVNAVAASRLRSVIPLLDLPPRHIKDAQQHWRSFSQHIADGGRLIEGIREVLLQARSARVR